MLFTDLKFSIEEQIGQRNKVVTRWTITGIHKGEFLGIAPTGKSVKATGISISKITNGKIVESWIS